ncbi:B12-binding domain-containing radical SAM protein [Deferrisoma camini]|uniref:B12-binding domain-containing radical SAM protein n=1 Tax=Deferrisoma camini TaxID=1035120 RepID=UPI00046D4738|nr:radical SAM protein [Deferrisoma camini]
MRILFVEPCPPRPHVFSRIRLPRLGPVLLATILRDRGHETRVVVEEVRPLRDEDLEWADVVGISSLTTTAARAYHWADRARSRGKFVFMGGPHPTFLPDEALDHADAVVRGEGDVTVPELVAALEEGRGFGEIAGVSFRADGVTVHTPDRPLIEDLDGLPTPDFSLVENWSGRRVTPVSTSRGCPFRCRFCSVIPMFGARYRFQSARRVLEDLEAYSRTTDHVFFCDDNFAANRRRTREICEGILERGFPLEWSAQVRVDLARDRDLVRLMARAGCWCVFVGLESVNPRTLEAYDKRQTVDDIRKAVATFRQAGIWVHGMFVLGADTDDPDTVRQTVRFAREAGIETVQFLALTPTPGTGLYDDMVAQGRILTRRWDLYDGHHVVFEPAQFTAPELQREITRATVRFYSLRRVTQAALRARWLEAAVALHAWHHARQFRRRERPFARDLRLHLVHHRAGLREILGSRRVRRLALPTLGVPPEQLRLLRRIAEGLRLQIVEMAESPEALLRRLATPPAPADVVVVPARPDLLPAGSRTGDLWTTRIGHVPVLGLPSDPAAFRRACRNLALGLARSARRGLRAYRRAVAAPRTGRGRGV